MNKKILIVDDSATIRRSVIQTLEPAGFEVLTACDGLSGIAKLQSTPDLSLVILDLNMPGLTGIGVLERLRDEKHQSPPIVMMTTEVAPSQIERAKQAGALAWVVKPFKPDQLVAMAKKLTTPRVKAPA
ncbi:MAG TPA: response regulator [Polyangiaceae bacterium]|nr:response regulator [Polyangiaceae bacterium]